MISDSDDDHDRECDTDHDELQTDHEESNSKLQSKPIQRTGKGNKRKYAGSFLYNVRFDAEWIKKNDCTGEFNFSFLSLSLSFRLY